MANKRLPRIALIFGGRGLESDISVIGAENLFGLIDEKRYEKIPVFIDKRGRFLVSLDKSITPSALASDTSVASEAYPALRGGVGGFILGDEFLEIDAAFPLLHGDFGEDGRVQGALECAGISFVGCDTPSGAICRDKTVVKAVAERLGIPTVRCVDARLGDRDAVFRAEERLTYPMFVKPARLGSSIGAGIASDRRELKKRLDYALTLDSVALIEEKIDTLCEMECGYFSAMGRQIFTEPGEIRSHGFYDYEKKYGGLKIQNDLLGSKPSSEFGIQNDLSGSKPKPENEISVSSTVDKAVCSQIQDYAARLVRALGVRDISRIDFFLSKDGRLYFNEINTMPGFTDASLYLKMLERVGIAPSVAVSLLIENALQRRS